MVSDACTSREPLTCPMNGTGKNLATCRINHLDNSLMSRDLGKADRPSPDHARTNSYHNASASSIAAVTSVVAVEV